MKLSHPFAFAVLVPLVAAAPGPAAAATTAPAPAVQEGDPFEVWKRDFLRAVEINEKKEMAQLVRRDNRIAVHWIINTCERISSGSSDELETFMAHLREAWTSSMKTDFPKIVYEYFALLEPHMLRERVKMKERYDELWTRLDKNAGKKDGPTYELLGKELKSLAGGFAEIGDHFYASQTWSLVSLCYREENRGPDANLFKQTESYREVLAARDRIDLKDKLYLETEVAYKYFKAQGYDEDEATAKERGGPGPGSIVTAEPIVVTSFEFDVVTEPGSIERPTYAADDVYPIWTQVNFGTKGSKAKFAALEGSPTLIREGSSEVKIDTDGDGTGDVKIPLTGNVEEIQLSIGQGENARPWAILATVGSSQDTYQGLQFNLAPSDSNMGIYVLNAASIVGTLNDEPIRILDDNMDGVFGSPPQTWEYLGMSKGVYQPELDSVVIGKEKRARPWSEYQKIGDQWYYFQNEGWGKEIKVTPVEIETGSLKVKYKGAKPSWLIVQGNDKYENTFIDLAVNGAKGVEVPKGYWKLYFGVLAKGHGSQMAKALIVGGDDTQWKVDKDEEAVIELGAPYKFDFAHEVEGGTLTVDGYSVKVVGAGGERYQRLWNCVPRPEVSYRKTGTKRGSKPEKMKMLGSQIEMEDINKENPGSGWRSAWFPLDLTVDVKRAEDGVEVQLTEKKNKLFGKIESDWKE